jgi:16S rRNA (uracil1498-N3)-methyltransferase
VTHVFRVFLPDPAPAEPGQERCIGAADARRLQRVLRLGVGDPIEVADARGRVLAATVAAESRVVCGAVVSEPRPAPPLAVRLAQAGPRSDTAVEKLVELGVERLGPLETAAMRREPRGDRWQRIAAAAAAQSKRARVPRVAAPIPLAEALDDHAIMLSHEDPDGTLDEALARVGRPVVLLVGPEAGFLPDELAAARAAGVPIATLGELVLRTETAAIVAAALALDRLGALAVQSAAEGDPCRA